MTIDMTTGPPLRKIVRFSLPMMAGALFQQLYNIVDMMVVGNAIGSRALAAIGVTFSVTFLAMSLSIGLTTGFTAVVSQYFGAKDGAMVRRSVSASVWISFACAALLASAGIFGAEPLMRLLGTPDDIFFDAVLYLKICVGGSIGTVFFNSSAALLRAVGDSRTPLIFLVVASILSALLSLLFILVFGMGVAGAAFATVIAQCLSAAACVAFMVKNSKFSA